MLFFLPDFGSLSSIDINKLAVFFITARVRYQIAPLGILYIYVGPTFMPVHKRHKCIVIPLSLISVAVQMFEIFMHKLLQRSPNEPLRAHKRRHSNETTDMKICNDLVCNMGMATSLHSR